MRLGFLLTEGRLQQLASDIPSGGSQSTPSWHPVQETRLHSHSCQTAFPGIQGSGLESYKGDSFRCMWTNCMLVAETGTFAQSVISSDWF